MLISHSYLGIYGCLYRLIVPISKSYVPNHQSCTAICNCYNASNVVVSFGSSIDFSEKLTSHSQEFHSKSIFLSTVFVIAMTNNGRDSA